MQTDAETDRDYEQGFAGYCEHCGKPSNWVTYDNGVKVWCTRDRAFAYHEQAMRDRDAKGSE